MPSAAWLAAWADVDVDVKQKFKCGGIQALLGHEADMLVMPDPRYRPGLVFDYARWLAKEYASKLAICVVRLGREGIASRFSWACARAMPESAT